MRKRTLLAALLLLLLPALAGAQVASFVTMTGTNANYPAGTLTANFLPPANSSQFDYLKYHFPFTVSTTLSGGGAWSMSLADTSTVLPASSQWRLQLCSVGTFGAPTCYSVVMAITCVNNVSCSGTTLDLTSTFAAAPVPPTGQGNVVKIASGATALHTALITSLGCDTTTATATGVLSTDALSWNPNGSIKAVTGYVPSLSGGLTISPFVAAGQVGWDVCNWTGTSITPGAVTINWAVSR